MAKVGQIVSQFYMSRVRQLAKADPALVLQLKADTAYLSNLFNALNCESKAVKHLQTLLASAGEREPFKLPVQFPSESD